MTFTQHENMPLWLQHTLVLALVAGCVGYVAWQTIRALRGRGGKVGSCCAKGCDPAAAAPARSATRSVVFLPESALTRRGKSRA